MLLRISDAIILWVFGLGSPASANQPDNGSEHQGNPVGLSWRTFQSSSGLLNSQCRQRSRHQWKSGAKEEAYHVDWPQVAVLSKLRGCDPDSNQRNGDTRPEGEAVAQRLPIAKRERQ